MGTGETGLEVCPGREATTEYAMGDEWTPCNPQEGAITVNVGYALMYWSDDKLKVSHKLLCNLMPCLSLTCPEAYASFVRNTINAIAALTHEFDNKLKVDIAVCFFALPVVALPWK